MREKVGLTAGMALKRRPAVGGAAAVQKVFLAKGAAEAKGCRWTGTRPIQRTRVGHAECSVSVTGEEAERSQIRVFPEWRGLHKGAGQSQMCRLAPGGPWMWAGDQSGGSGDADCAYISGGKQGGAC